MHAINNYTLYAGLRGSEVTVDPKLSHGRHHDREWCSPVNILWDADPTALERYRFAVGGDTQALESASMVARALHDNLGIQQVVIGPDVLLEQACELAEAARLDRPELGVILLRHRVDVTALQQALRSGVREVVHGRRPDGPRGGAPPQPRADGQAHGDTSAGGSGAEGKVITVFSAKGGVGKTTLSTNVATYLADSRAHAPLLVDLDLAFGDVAISLQLVPKKSIYDAVAMSGHLDQAGLEALVTTHEASGLDVLCAPSNPGDADRIPVNVVSEVLKVARGHYDYVIVDTPPSFTEHVLSAL